ncbi:MAG TPA: four helix bundle protein [Puia sp.]|nr:four helix bundle protein [Puia sp.]
MSYRNLEIWALAREVVIEIHNMSMNLPKFEMYEEGSQIRKSSKTTKSAIVEGYGRRRYKQDWLKFLVYAHSSNNETIDHLENLWETKSLNDVTIYHTIWEKLEVLGKKLNHFIVSVEEKHQSKK